MDHNMSADDELAAAVDEAMSNVKPDSKIVSFLKRNKKRIVFVTLSLTALGAVGYLASSKMADEELVEEPPFDTVPLTPELNEELDKISSKKPKVTPAE